MSLTSQCDFRKPSLRLSPVVTTGRCPRNFESDKLKESVVAESGYFSHSKMPEQLSHLA